MRNHFTKAAICCALAVARVASAQTQPAEAVSNVVANPTYISIPLAISVNRAAAEAWPRVAEFCDSGEGLRIPCTIAGGKDGELGAVRPVGVEVLVVKTELSYTYTQTVRAGRPFNV